MSSLTIVTREAKDGPRYFVRFRLGGRAYPWVHAGAFKTQKEAKIRRDLVAGEIAAGRNPTDVLRALAASPATVASLETWGERFLGSRIDIDANTKKNYAAGIRKINETFGDRDPSTITATEIAEWIAVMAETRKPGTLGQYLIAFKLVLDHVGLDPNVARDPRIKLPKHVREEPQPPSREHFEAIIEALGRKWKLLFVTIEQGALRVGEAVSLRWADVDAAGLRLRLPRSATKRDRARWVYLPEWLMEAIEATCPLEDRVPDRRVFQGMTEDGARAAMTQACKLAKVPHYHPHDLRHRRATIWHQSGVSARDLAERMGHSKPSMSLDVYSHVMPPDEVESERVLSLLTDEGSH